MTTYILRQRGLPNGRQTFEADHVHLFNINCRWITTNADGSVMITLDASFQASVDAYNDLIIEPKEQ